MKKIKDALAKIKNKKILIPVFLVLLIILGASAVYLTNGELGSILEITSDQNQETKKFINKIGKLIDLPNETPILATVSDVTRLSNQPFYDNAQNGDKVLIFKDSKMAVLYRPSTNRIVKVGTVTVEEPKEDRSATKSAKKVTESLPPASPKPTAPQSLLKVVIYNATTTPGLAKTSGDRLESKYQNIEITGTANASADYTKTLVVDLSGKNKTAAQTLAKELGGEVGALPKSETKPDADILIIVASE